MFSADSTNSGHPYFYSSRFQIIVNPFSGFPMLEEGILNAYFDDSGSNHFANKSISSNGLTFYSLVLLMKLDFHIAKVSARSMKLVKREIKRSIFNRN